MLPKLGSQVTLEKRLNGERADLVAEKGKEKIAIEIETGNSNAIKNIKKCLQAGFDIVVSVPVNKEIEIKTREQMKRQGLAKNKRVFVVGLEGFE